LALITVGAGTARPGAAGLIVGSNLDPRILRGVRPALVIGAGLAMTTLSARAPPGLSLRGSCPSGIQQLQPLCRQVGTFRAEVTGCGWTGVPGGMPSARLTGAMTEMGDAAPRPGSRAFVGRDREVAELLAALEDAAGGRGRLFLIAGEPGIGKTWLAEHLATHATGQGTRVVWGRCWEGGGAPPFWPWGQLIRALAEDLDEQTLASWPGAGTAHVAQLVPGLAERLGATTTAAVGSQESDAARFYLFEAVTGLFRRAALVQPLLLVLDDLHAADEPSMLLLRFLARDLRGARHPKRNPVRHLLGRRLAHRPGTRPGHHPCCCTARWR
jgi:hypothetical protein